MCLRVTSKNKQGEAYLVITQDEQERTINLSGVVDEYIDINPFAQSKLNMLVLYESAGEINIDISLSNEQNTNHEAALHKNETVAACKRCRHYLPHTQ